MTHRFVSTAIIAGMTGLPVLASAQPTVRVNLGPGGAQGDGINTEVAASDDGRHVVFASTSTNLVPGGTSGRQVFAADRDPDGNGVLDEGNTLVTLMSLGIDGLPGNGSQGGFNGFHGVDLSADGRFVLWSSQSTNLVAGDTSGFGSYDIFVRDRDPDGNGVFDESNGVTERVNVGPGGLQADHPDSGADQMGISGDGRFVVYSSSATNLVPGDSQDVVPNIYLHDRQTGLNNRLDLLTSTQNVGSRYPQISTDGSWVVYAAYADFQNFTNKQIIVVGPADANPVVVSKNDNGILGNGDSGTNPNTRGPRISGDGRFVAFVSLATNLDVTRAGDPSNTFKLFLHDRDSDGNGVFDEPGGFTTRRVDVGPGGVAADGFFARDPDLADNGRLVFTANASNLVPGDTTPTTLADTYLYEPAAGTLEVISRATNGDQANSNCFFPVLTGDGAQAVFGSQAFNLVPGDTNGRDDIFARTLPPAACNSAELAPPFGTLDLADITAFVAGFTGLDPIADLDHNGLFDLADIGLFVNAFLAGCP